MDVNCYSSNKKYISDCWGEILSASDTLSTQESLLGIMTPVITTVEIPSDS